MSEREPNFRADPQPEPIPAPVAEIEAEIKAEIAAEMEAERRRAEVGTTSPNGSVDGGGDESVPNDRATVGSGTGDGWPDPPPPVDDPAAEVLAWLRGEFDDLNANLQNLSNRLSRQEEAVLRVTGAQEEELNSTLAELEGSSAQLRNEAATLRVTRSELAESLPRLVTDAVRTAVGGTLADAVAEMRGSVAQLGAALAEALPAAVAEALAPAAGAVPAEVVGPAASGQAAADDPDPDLVTQLHDAQDEAAEWFNIVVDEAVRRAVERWLPPALAPAAGDTAAPLSPAAPVGSDGAPQTASDPAPPEPEVTGADPVAPTAAGPSTGETVTPPLEASGNPVAVSGDDEAPEQAPPASDPAATASPASAEAPDADGATPESGITCLLPGVAVGPTLAMGVSSALGRARLRRRRRRAASAPAAGLFRHDPFAGELSRSLERFALARRDLAWRPDASAADSGNGSDQGRSSLNLHVVVAERDGRELAVDLTAGPLALAGPDADDAARALVATFLSADDTAGGRVVVADDLLPPGRPFPGLDRFDDLSSALDDLEAEIADRAGTPSGHGAGGGVDGRRPAVVLVTPAPPVELRARLARIAEQGSANGVAAVVVGAQAGGPGVVTVDSGGRIGDVASSDGTDLAGARLYCLGPSAMSEVLAVLAAARTDDEPHAVVPVQAELFPVLTGAGTAPIQVRVLGPYRIDVGGEEIRSGLRAKARELLAFYLLHPEGTTLDVATEALWPEADAGRGSEWFWTALGNLRSRLRSVTGTKSLKIIERDGDRYRVEPVFDVDLWRFQAALPPPGASTGDPQWAAALQGAADMYDGELLAGVDWAWADVPREDLRRRAVDVLVSLGATRLVAGDVRGALDVLSHAVEVDPVAEQLYRRIMRLHAKQSRPDEVQATFDRLKARLGQLGLEPTVESTQLLEELVG